MCWFTHGSICTCSSRAGKEGVCHSGGEEEAVWETGEVSTRGFRLDTLGVVRVVNIHYVIMVTTEILLTQGPGAVQ